jgi:hypothetical protein
MNGQVRYGKRLYYAAENPFLGNRLCLNLSASIQPNARLTQDFELHLAAVQAQEDGFMVYDLNLILSRTTYQFNRNLFLRALIQYDSYNRAFSAMH